jgi:hypothetical protein
LGGLLAKHSALDKFDTDWRSVCAAAGLREPFHMKDLAARKGEFSDWQEDKRRHILGELIAAIRSAEAIPIGSVVSLNGFNLLPPDIRRGFKDPHFLAFQTLAYQIAVAASMQWETGPVTMVFAHHPEHSDGIGNTEQLWDSVRRHNPIVALFMESYVCGEPKDYPGLQAADLWAYELRHHFEVIRPSSRQPRWPFAQFVKLGLNYEFTHDFISYHDENGLSGAGQMSRVQRLGEIDLYQPRFIGLPPADARKLDAALRTFTASLAKQPKKP